MEKLLQQSEGLVTRTLSLKHRYLFDQVNWKNRLIGIKGARGTGKTTMLLQRLKSLDLPATVAAYFSLDDLYFTVHQLSGVVEKFYRQGGKYLFLDEVHKYPGWSTHIKNLYDFYPDLSIVFTGSSIIDITRQEADLSRRALMYELFGLSYREFLEFSEIGTFHPISLDTLISPAREWRRNFPTDFRPLQHFRDYLQLGYYPFSLEDKEGYGARLNQLIRTIVEYDMAELHDFDIRNAKKMLQLLYVLSANVPFKPNLKKLAEKSDIHRNTVNSYLHFLEQARLIRQLYPAGISVAILQKPEKIYLDNTNLAYALHPGEPDKGNLRETFFASQLRVGHQLTYPSHGDFLVDENYVFEVGGKSKGNKQLQHIPNGYVVADDTEYPVSQLPLWIFGFLY